MVTHEAYEQQQSVTTTLKETCYFLSLTMAAVLGKNNNKNKTKVCYRELCLFRLTSIISLDFKYIHPTKLHTFPIRSQDCQDVQMIVPTLKWLIEQEADRHVFTSSCPYYQLGVVGD